MCQTKTNVWYRNKIILSIGPKQIRKERKRQADRKTDKTHNQTNNNLLNLLIHWLTIFLLSLLHKIVKYSFKKLRTKSHI